MYKMTDEELEELSRTGTGQQRKLARTILVNRELRNTKVASGSRLAYDGGMDETRRFNLERGQRYRFKFWQYSENGRRSEQVRWGRYLGRGLGDFMIDIDLRSEAGTAQLDVREIIEVTPC